LTQGKSNKLGQVAASNAGSRHKPTVPPPPSPRPSRRPVAAGGGHDEDAFSIRVVLRAAKAVNRGNTEAIFHRDTAVGQGWRLGRFAVADLIGSDLLGFKPCPFDQTPTGGGFILDEKDWSKWLGEEPATEQELFALLRPCPDEWLKIWPIDNKVGNVRNTGRELMPSLEKVLEIYREGRSNHCYNESICWECHPLPGDGATTDET
jgi:hypothetical protein